MRMRMRIHKHCGPALLLVLCVLGTASSLAGEKQRTYIHATVDTKTVNGFTALSYERMLGYTPNKGYWIYAPVYVEGADVSKIIVGEKWFGAVLDCGIITNKLTNREYRYYKVVSSKKE